MKSNGEESRSRGKKEDRKQDQERGQSHTTRDVLRKAPREQYGELLQEPPAPSGSTNTRHVCPGEL